jgi:hypothetical protein
MSLDLRHTIGSELERMRQEHPVVLYCILEHLLRR